MDNSIKTTKLTFKERFNLLKYTHKLPCTMKLRTVIDAFFNQIEVTAEEKMKFNISVDPKTYELNCSDDSYTVEFKDFPKDVISAIRNYVEAYDGREELKNNVALKNAINIFKKVI